MEVLASLRRGDVNIVVATCVEEEGLDVANTDLVVFYEPVPSAIRSIQRRGRSGEKLSRSGFVVLITIDTKDVGIDLLEHQEGGGNEEASAKDTEGIGQSEWIEP